MPTVCSKCFSNKIKLACAKKDVETNEVIKKYPKCCFHCDNTDLVFIDDLMYFIIHLLNTNGYKTFFCCEGHFYNDPLKDNRLGYLYMEFDENIRKVINKTLSKRKDMRFTEKIKVVDETKDNKKTMVFHFYLNTVPDNIYDYTHIKANFYQKLFSKLQKKIVGLSY